MEVDHRRFVGRFERKHRFHIEREAEKELHLLLLHFTFPFVLFILGRLPIDEYRWADAPSQWRPCGNEEECEGAEGK